jgi:hypothetical protein
MHFKTSAPLTLSLAQEKHVSAILDAQVVFTKKGEF